MPTTASANSIIIVYAAQHTRKPSSMCAENYDNHIDLNNYLFNNLRQSEKLHSLLFLILVDTL